MENDDTAPTPCGGTRVATSTSQEADRKQKRLPEEKGETGAWQQRSRLYGAKTDKAAGKIGESTL